MNSLGRVLLIVGAIVLAVLVGVLIGRSRHEPSVAEAPAAGVQISTQAPPAPPPTPSTLLPTVPDAPPAKAVPKINPQDQVADDAAAVGMTTRDAPEEPAPPVVEPPPPEPRSDAPPYG
ncbi:hypothetical protein DJ021_14630 [Phenylobacterium hankyongense]|uniref:Uncharacterized protein n=1 Tax=Phenylobacterium hankyongense TaxID=1813876 RepID=A0A328B4V9_9CAUL|nr:hypothetical protein [Phenylobacterium hankyongense]RAK60956.1 hypothetical protein DJ021_14630 [Phenylobacterium hankyongense]